MISGAIVPDNTSIPDQIFAHTTAVKSGYVTILYVLQRNGASNSGDLVVV